MNKSLSPEDRSQIMRSVIEAEKITSVEFMVHIDPVCPEDVVVKARSVFKILQMNKQKKKYWLLFYLSYEDRKYTIIGDDGLNKMLPENFWADVQAIMRNHLKEGRPAASLIDGITLAGKKLQPLIKKQANDINELPDEITGDW